MCTQTDDVSINTENQELENEIVENGPRDINILLSLETYQGMTDTEIDMILEYKIRQAVTSQEVLMRAAIETERMNSMIETSRANAQRALDMIEYLINREYIETPSVQPKTVSPRVTEVRNES